MQWVLETPEISGFVDNVGCITPPVGFNLFILKAVIPGVEMGEIIRGSLIFIIPLALGIVILMIFPELALMLPRLMR